MFFSGYKLAQFMILKYIAEILCGCFGKSMYMWENTSLLKISLCRCKKLRNWDMLIEDMPFSGNLLFYR